VSERVIARLSRPDARELLVDDRRDDFGKLQSEADTLRLRLEQSGKAFADGELSIVEFKASSARLRERLSDLEARMHHVDRAPLLADLVTAHDVRAKWNAIGLDRQRAVIDLLYTVTLLPGIRGKRKLSPESVRMEPKA
jgi:site-specific DNA recombinase